MIDKYLKMEKAPIIIKAKKAAYTISFKLKCIHKVESGVSMHKVAEKAGIDRASISDWLKQKEVLFKKITREIVLDYKELEKNL